MTAKPESVRNPQARWGGAFFSPRFFFVRAIALGLLFLFAQLGGLREYTTFLSGTTANPEVSRAMSALCGITYLLLYMGCVVIAPILLIASGLLAIWGRRRSSDPG